MSEPLIDRIGYRLKFVRGVDRRLLIEAREALRKFDNGCSPPVGLGMQRPPQDGFFIPMEPGETRADAFQRVVDSKLLPWMRKRLNEAEL